MSCSGSRSPNGRSNDGPARCHRGSDLQTARGWWEKVTCLIRGSGRTTRPVLLAVVLICLASQSSLQSARSHACDGKQCTATAGPSCRANAGTGRCDCSPGVENCFGVVGYRQCCDEDEGHCLLPQISGSFVAKIASRCALVLCM